MKPRTADSDGFIKDVEVKDWVFSEEPYELWLFLENLYANVPSNPNRFYKKKLKYYSNKFKNYRDSI